MAEGKTMEGKWKRVWKVMKIIALGLLIILICLIALPAVIPLYIATAIAILKN